MIHALFYGHHFVVSAVVTALAQNLRAFIDSDAQIAVATCIFEGRFGKNERTIATLVQNLGAFTSPVAHLYIVLAKVNSRLGVFSPQSAIDELQTLLKDSKMQKYVALAIQKRVFRNNEEVLAAFAKLLFVFTDPKAQQRISLAIHDQRFGTNPRILRDVAQNLEVFTDSKAQRHVAKAIRCGFFGTDSEVLTKLALSLRVFTDPVAKIDIGCALRDYTFGRDSSVNTALSENYRVFTDRFLNIALQIAIFGDDIYDIFDEQSGKRCANLPSSKLSPQFRRSVGTTWQYMHSFGK